MKFIPDDDFIGVDDTENPVNENRQIIVSQQAGEGGTMQTIIWLGLGVLALYLLTRKR